MIWDFVSPCSPIADARNRTIACWSLSAVNKITARIVCRSRFIRLSGLDNLRRTAVRIGWVGIPQHMLISQQVVAVGDKGIARRSVDAAQRAPGRWRIP